MKDDKEGRVSELELTIEEMERTHSILYGILLALITRIIFGAWYWSVIVGIGGAFVYWRYMAKRPFTSRTTVDDGSTG